ncbi:hypothetical protein [Streptomyces vastus]|uniref:Uncharacterized protein n=1 Tax=Streptomyces vastus TaxID=285451 RepID=A0ABN3Q7U2_9ACTN
MSLPERVERVCEELGRGHLPDLAREAGALPLLERIVASVRAGIPEPEGMSADLDSLDEALAALGIDGVTGADRSYEELPGTATHRPEDVWVCPERRCARGLPAAADGPVPVCAVLGTPLERVGLLR